MGRAARVCMRCVRAPAVQRPPLASARPRRQWVVKLYASLAQGRRGPGRMGAARGGVGELASREIGESARERAGRPACRLATTPLFFYPPGACSVSVLPPLPHTDSPPLPAPKPSAPARPPRARAFPLGRGVARGRAPRPHITRSRTSRTRQHLSSRPRRAGPRHALNCVPSPRECMIYAWPHAMWVLDLFFDRVLTLSWSPPTQQIDLPPPTPSHQKPKMATASAPAGTRLPEGARNGVFPQPIPGAYFLGGVLRSVRREREGAAKERRMRREEREPLALLPVPPALFSHHPSSPLSSPSSLSL